MRETDYAYGVARIRANESSLLDSKDFERMVTAVTFSDALRVLTDKGWNTDFSDTDYSGMLIEEMSKAWTLITEAVPDIHEMDALVITNDFNNLKASIKLMLHSDIVDNLFISPSVYSAQDINEAVKVKNFNALPDCMQNVAPQAYDMIVRLSNPQMSDIIIDRCALETRLKLSKNSDCEALREIVELSTAAINIKIALRCAAIGKGEDFLRTAICESATLNKDLIIKAATDGAGSVVDFVKNSANYSDAAESLSQGGTAFEKWCDDKIMTKVKDARFKAFGLDPILAYYIAKDTEVKNTRVILNAKLNNIDSREIRKRVRDTYV